MSCESSKLIKDGFRIAITSVQRHLSLLLCTFTSIQFVRTSTGYVVTFKRENFILSIYLRLNIFKLDFWCNCIYNKLIGCFWDRKKRNIAFWIGIYRLETLFFPDFCNMVFYDLKLILTILFLCLNVGGIRLKFQKTCSICSLSFHNSK